MDVTLELVAGDITTVLADAIVNAANSALAGGGGVDGAIHRAGGPTIMEECRRLGGCPTGDARATGAGDLPARHVIHAVGPVWHGGASGEPEALASAHRRSVEVADELGCESVAFPAISTGAYGFPGQLAAEIAVNTVRSANTEVELVRLVAFDAETFVLYRKALDNRS
jgi:O-acetyl-ADP-ribose deacetylase (regulator of RNase III)